MLYDRAVRSALVIAVGLTACRFEGAAAITDAGADAIVTIDAPDAPPGSTCVGTATFLQVCVPPNVTVGDLMINNNGSNEIDTSNDSRCTMINQGPLMLCALVYRDLTIMKPWRATGTRPL